MDGISDLERTPRGVSLARLVPEETDDATLVAAIAQRADRPAFAALFRRHAPRVRAHLVARGAAPGTADELTQDVMLLLWRKADRFDASKGSVATWLYAITRNCLFNHLRQQRRPEAAADDPVAAVGPVAASPSDQLIAGEQWRALAHSLEALPVEQREVLRGAYWRGQTLQECAEDLGVPLGTVKTRVRLALARLRAMFSQRGSNDG